jgi:hypothetical protein
MGKHITYKLRIFRLCQGQFRLFFKQISANFAKDASKIFVAAALSMKYPFKSPCRPSLGRHFPVHILAKTE